jgi:hypothetical protein
LAFLDRADLRLHVGLPGAAARARIIGDQLRELVRVGVVTACEGVGGSSWGLGAAPLALEPIVAATAGMSGRALRKLPVQVLAHMQARGRRAGRGTLSIHAWLDAVAAAVAPPAPATASCAYAVDL